jgi:hypothetical protein
MMPACSRIGPLRRFHSSITSGSAPAIRLPERAGCPEEPRIDLQIAPLRAGGVGTGQPSSAAHTRSPGRLLSCFTQALN